MKQLEFNNGDKMPILGLGTWKANPGQVEMAVKESLKIGYRHIDCAAVYGNEMEIGNALSESFAAGVVARKDLWITSKLWNNAHKSKDVMPALKKTLQDLQLEYIDLYLIHWPIAFQPGVNFPAVASEFLSLEEAPIIKTWRALEKCAKAGLCRHIGVSNFSTKKITDLLAEAEIKPEVNQIELHPFLQQNAMLQFCQEHNIHVTAYSPLGSKDRSANVKDGDEPDLMGHPTIAKLAEQHNCTPAQILLSWAVHRNTSVIPKSVRPQRLQENLAAAEVVLSEADMAEIAKMDQHYRFINGKFWEMKGAPYTVANLWDE